MDAPIAITMGDPAGVGPEVICKALAALGDDACAGITVIGSLAVLERANTLCSTGLTFGGTSIEVLDLPTTGVAGAPAGEVSAAAGEAAYRYILKAAEMAQADETGCIVTAPINKAALHAAWTYL